MNALDHQVAGTVPEVCEAQFCRWLGSALPGDKLAYHRGHLVRDCEKARNDKQRTALLRLARRAYAASEAGLVHLLQRRHGADDYTYFAVARRKSLPRRGALSRVLGDATGGA
jgi:hypothetical protein